MFPAPFDPLHPLRELDRQLGELLNKYSGESTTGENGDFLFFAPSVNTREDDSQYTIEADLPGVKKDGVKIEVAGGVLRISGERKDERKEEGEGYFRRESTFGRFQRSFSLSSDMDTDKVVASYSDGVLTVSIPKRAIVDNAERKQIPIQ